MEECILELRNIGKTFSGVTVLKDVNIQLKKGEIFALMGENGAGKSTLIKIISGYHQPDPGGEIFVHGKKMDFHKPKDAMDAHIHTIYQELTLCPDMTVAENIVIDKQDAFPGFLTHKKEYIHIAEEALARLGQKVNPNAYVRDISIAKQQIVEIAKAISVKAEIIIMDEPTSSISEKDTEALIKIARDLRDSGFTIIYISHRMHEIFQIADRICVLRDGGLVSTVNASETTQQQLVQMMVGRSLDNAYPKADVLLGDVVLELKDLCSDVFDNVSVTVRRGEICGIGGLVGSKRTEILECLFGLRPIKSGKIYVYGKEFIPTSQKAAIDQGICFLTEDRKRNGVVLCLSVNENINTVNADQICSKNGVLDLAKFREMTEKYRNALNIRLASAMQPVSTLSGGNMQKVAIAKWMEMNPQIILFDEPTRGIDIGAKAEIYAIMAEFVKRGTAIVMVSSELPELISVTDKIVVMCEGHMTGTVSREHASQELIMTLASSKNANIGDISNA